MSKGIKKVINKLTSEEPLGLDDILAVAQVLTANRGNDLGGFTIYFNNGFISLPQTPEFPDNAAALAGGVPNGAFYYTIVDGERIIKQAHD